MLDSTRRDGNAIGSEPAGFLKAERLMAEPKSEIRSAPRPNCLLCNLEGKLVYEGLVDPFFSAPGVWQMRECARSECGLLWLDPSPFPEDLHLAYQKYFTHGEQDAPASTSSRLRTALYSVYQSASNLPAILNGLARAKREAQHMYLDDVAPGKLLDVGCGDGLFLNRMRALGWAVDGVDFDARAIKNAKAKFNLDLHHGDLKSVKFTDKSFDAITLSHVIEHVPDPIGLLREVRRILKAGGRAVLTTPNNQSMGRRKFGPYWFGLDAPRHLQVFSPLSLSETAHRAGFEKIRSFSTAANADIFIGASFSIRDSKDHRTSDQPPPNILRTVKAMALQYREQSRLPSVGDCGEELVVVCA